MTKDTQIYRLINKGKIAGALISYEIIDHMLAKKGFTRIDFTVPCITHPLQLGISCKYCKPFTKAI